MGSNPTGRTILQCEVQDIMRTHHSQAAKNRSMSGPADLSTPKLGADNMRATLRRIAKLQDVAAIHEMATRALAFDKRMHGNSAMHEWRWQ